MNNEPQFLKQIRSLVGQRVRHRGRAWQVIDYLSDDRELVLEHLGRPIIQADQHGNGRRRTLETLSVPLFDDSGRRHPDFQALDFLQPDHD